MSVRYPPLAEAARVQGDVHLKISSGVVTVFSGPPLLVQTAVESAKALGSIQDEANLEVTYHFALVDTTTVPTTMTVKRGNAFGRAVLRMFGLKTEKMVFDPQCQEGVPPANDFKVAGAVIDIWVNGRTRCIQTETEAPALVARR